MPTPNATVPDPRRALLTIIGAASAALAVAAAFSHAGLSPTSAELSRATATWPDAVRDAAPIVSELGLVVLILAIGIAAWTHRRSDHHLARLAAGGFAAGLAYVGSEALKVAVAQPRPCQELAGVVTAAHCPPLGDWSLPSNHAVIATGLATALVLAFPRTWRWALATVAIVLAARVAAGVHYPHDVLTGALLAVLFVASAVALLDSPARHLSTRALGNPLVARLLRRT